MTDCVIRVAPNCPIERFEVILPLFMPLATAFLEDPHRLGLPALLFTAAPYVIRSDEQVGRFGQDGRVTVKIA